MGPLTVASGDTGHALCCGHMRFRFNGGADDRQRRSPSVIQDAFALVVASMGPLTIVSGDFDLVVGHGLLSCASMGPLTIVSGDAPCAGLRADLDRASMGPLTIVSGDP